MLNYFSFNPLTLENAWVRSQHCGYWCPGAKAPGHQYPQCWLNIHFIAPVSCKNIAHKVNSIRKWNHILKTNDPGVNLFFSNIFHYWNILGELGQYHSCWCTGIARAAATMVLSMHELDFKNFQLPTISQGRETTENANTVMSLLEAPCAKTSWKALLFGAILGITGALIVCFKIWWFKQANNSETGFGGHHCDFELHVPCLTVHVCMN